MRDTWKTDVHKSQQEVINNYKNLSLFLDPVAGNEVEFGHDEIPEFRCN